MSYPMGGSPAMQSRARRYAWIAAIAALSGCTSLSADRGFGSIEQITRQRLNQDLRWARTAGDQEFIDQRVAELLVKPLSVDDAVQVALLNNKGLQASFFELGISAADVEQAGRLPNPGFTFGRLSRGREIEIDRGVTFNIARLLMLPMVDEMETRRFERIKAQTAMNVLSLAAATRKAYFNALAAEQSARYMEQVRQAAEASAELARRMQQAGNFNKLEQAREQGFYADAAVNLARAQQQQRASREQLIRRLGLWGTQTAFALPEHLPELPGEPDELPDVERTAMMQRLDVQAALRATEQTAKNLGLTKATRFVNVFEFGLVRNTFNQPPSLQHGYEISLELPLFDWGDAHVARAEAQYMRAASLAAETAINARSEVREAYGAYRSAFDIARHYRDEIVPLHRRIAEENQLRYNGMLISVFDLLVDARAQIGSVNSYIESLRDFWLAQSDLGLALIARPVFATATGSALPAEAGPATN